MSDVTKADLHKMQEGIEAHVTLKINGLTKAIDDHHITLYGSEGRNGLVGDLREISLKTRHIYGIMTFIGVSLTAIVSTVAGAALVKFFFK